MYSFHVHLLDIKCYISQATSMTIRLWLHQVVGYHCRFSNRCHLAWLYPSKKIAREITGFLYWDGGKETWMLHCMLYYDLANLVKQRGAPYFTLENILWSSVPMSWTVLAPFPPPPKGTPEDEDENFLYFRFERTACEVILNPRSDMPRFGCPWWFILLMSLDNLLTFIYGGPSACDIIN